MNKDTTMNKDVLAGMRLELYLSILRIAFARMETESAVKAADEALAAFDRQFK